MKSFIEVLHEVIDATNLAEGFNHHHHYIAGVVHGISKEHAAKHISADDQKKVKEFAKSKHYKHLDHSNGKPEESEVRNAYDEWKS